MPLRVIFDYARTYAAVIANLRGMESRVWAKRTLTPEQVLLLPTEDLATRIVAALSGAKAVCQHEVPISHLVPEIDRFSDDITNGITLEHIQTNLRNLILRMLDALREKFFYYVPPDRVGWYRGKELFGHEVSLAFPAVADDIAEAGKCLALGRSTAAVFHLMRVMEYAVQRFGRRLRVKIIARGAPGAPPVPVKIKDATWFTIMVEVNKKVQGMQSGRKKVLFGKAATHLDLVRMAWRNETMHPKATYTYEQATEVWNAVGTFMRSFVEVVV